MVFPWPVPDPGEQEKVTGLIRAAREIAGDQDYGKFEEERWIPDKLLRELGEAGLLGLYVDEKYGGQGLSQTGYARVFETFTHIDATLSIVLGVHQSIGYKAIHLFGIGRAEGAVPPRPLLGQEARRVRPDRARTPARTPTTSSRAPSSRPTAPGS